MTVEIEDVRCMLGRAWESGGAEQVLAFCDQLPYATLKAVVTDTVFGMAAGERGIPSWLRWAERALDSR